MTITQTAPLDLELAAARIDRAHRLVGDLAAGTTRWKMTIPANPAADSDLILSRALADAEQAVAELAKARADRDRLPEPTVNGLSLGERAEVIEFVTGSINPDGFRSMSPEDVVDLVLRAAAPRIDARTRTNVAAELAVPLSKLTAALIAVSPTLEVP